MAKKTKLPSKEAAWDARTPEERIAYLRGLDKTMEAPCYANLLKRMSVSKFAQLSDLQKEMLLEN